MTQQRLTEKEANEIGGAIHDLDQLDAKMIVEKDDAARAQALSSFLRDKMVLHATEFLAAWFTMKHEYEPYLSAQASMLGNVMLVIQNRQRYQEAQQAQQEAAAEAAAPAETSAKQAEPDNVVPINAN